MEIRIFVAELKKEAAGIEPRVKALQEKADGLRASLEAAESELAAAKDRLAAIRMSVESLELLESQPETAAKPVPAKRPGHQHSRKPKRIVKMDAKGGKICTYASINKCAAALGWTTTGVRRYIDGVSREKQLRLRGFVLSYEE